MNFMSPIENNTLILKNYLLDPLSTIIKLAILSKKMINCKISIKNNVILLNEYGPFQSIVRFYNNTNKNDIHFLSSSIELACIHFIKNKNSKIEKLFLCAIDGLLNLIQTYKNFPIIIHCLQFYISIIKNYLNENNDDNTIYIKIDDINGIYDMYNDELIKNLNERWDDNKISMIIEMIEYLSLSSVVDTGYIESFMIPIDKSTQEIINNYNI
jgi:hypothetical protein